MDGTVLYANRQIVKRYLCADCEDVFSKKGERLVVGECFRNRSRFLIQRKLAGAGPSGTFGFQPYYHPVDLLEVDAERYRYFAASILWRVTSTDWGAAELEYLRGALSADAESCLRSYLLGGAPLEDVFVTVYVDSDTDPLPMMSLPSGDLASGGHCSFYLPGVKFNIYVGEDADADVTREFRRLKTNIIFFLRGFRGTDDHRQAVSMMTHELSPKGRLARLLDEKVSKA